MDEFTADPCPTCKPNTVCRTPSCGRLKGKRQEPVIENKQAAQGKDILLPPHPKHFGIPAEHWDATKHYAEYAMQNKQAEPVAWMCDVLQADATFKRELSFETPPPDGTYYSIRGRTPLYTHPAPAVAVDHSDLIKRIDAAIDRVVQGRGLMSIPADPRSDVDLVLTECKALLQGEKPPFWATEFYPAVAQPPADVVRDAILGVQEAAELLEALPSLIDTNVEVHAQIHETYEFLKGVLQTAKEHRL